MHRKLCLGLGILLGSFQVSTFAQAQDPPRIIQTQPGTPPAGQQTPLDPAAPSRFSAEDPKPNPGSDPEQPAAPSYGPTAPEKIGTFKDLFWCNSGISFYGWLDSGYTYSSTGSGRLATEPRENRFGNEFLLNQLGLVFEKTLKQGDEFDWGFNATFYTGADPALIQPKGEFNTTDPRFGADFRQLYVSAHLPILTEDGVDIRAGRMGTVIGYTSALAPYRPFYSNNYAWFYAQDGAFTGALATFHVNKQLDVIGGITMGANTFFTLRGDSPCYIGQVNYWTTEEKDTLLSASVYLGNNAIFAAPGLAGDFDTTVELRVHHNWSKRFTQILQCDMGWDNHVPGVGTGSWYSLYTIGLYHLNENVDLNGQIEWFNDVQGTRTGFKNQYEMATLGINYHPVKYIELRPEVRGDFANDRPAFGPRANHKDQFTAAIDLLLKF